MFRGHFGSSHSKPLIKTPSSFFSENRAADAAASRWDDRGAAWAWHCGGTGVSFPAPAPPRGWGWTMLAAVVILPEARQSVMMDGGMYGTDGGSQFPLLPPLLRTTVHNEQMVQRETSRRLDILFDLDPSKDHGNLKGGKIYKYIGVLKGTKCTTFNCPLRPSG